MLSLPSLTLIDWLVIASFFCGTLLIGLLFSKRGGSSLADYFVAGRKMTWWVAGTSIVATSFGADTPLVIAGWMRTEGLQRNWFWWGGLMGMMLCTFFFARLWRRANILTDVEFIELRYSGKPAAGLRMFHAVYRSLIQNTLVMGWVTLAMVKILDVTLDIPTVVFTTDQWMPVMVSKGVAVESVVEAMRIAEWPIYGTAIVPAKATGIVLCFGVAALYSSVSGLWGVMATDFFQFGLAMIGSFVLMGCVLFQTGGPDAMLDGAKAQLEAGAVVNGLDSSKVVGIDQLDSFLPPFDLSNGGLMAIWALIVFVGLQWWAGGEGGGFLAQRLFSCKNEKHSVLAMLWFCFANYVLRPWPWIVVGVASLVLIPDITAYGDHYDEEHAYVVMLMQYLPTGVRGLMVAALMAAFMSTISTHINFGASYVVNDVYRRFVRPDCSDREGLFAAKMASAGLAILAGVYAFTLDSIATQWLVLFELMSGVGFVMLLRWYWWRINVWSEISAMASSLVVFSILNYTPLLGNLLTALGGDPSYLDEYAVRFTVNLVVTSTVWIATTFLTPPEPKPHLERFYQRVRPGGWWAPIADRSDTSPLPRESLNLWLCWFLGVTAIISMVVGVGQACFGRYTLSGVALLLATIATIVMLKKTSRIRFD